MNLDEDTKKELTYYRNKLKEVRQEKRNCKGNAIGEVEMRRSLQEEIEEIKEEIEELLDSEKEE